MNTEEEPKYSLGIGFWVFALLFMISVYNGNFTMALFCLCFCAFRHWIVVKAQELDEGVK